MKGIMIQGTGSDAGKSYLATGLCRIFSDRGLRVCPFKSQNMSNNSHVTGDGLEMGRAQAVQAEAARLEPRVFMNPILLKPRRDTASEIILMGRVLDVPADREYYRTFTIKEGIAAVREALAYIGGNFDAVVIEGAGSPAEVNLNATEIVNMRVAREADVPVLLVADVDRGGALASVVGTLELLGEDRGRVRGIIFNKFRGDRSLFEPAVRWTEERTGIRVVGVMPWLPNIRVAGEDSLSIRWSGVRKKYPEGRIIIGVVRLPYISNFTDLEPFSAERDVDMAEVDAGTSLRQMDAILLPGTKSTVQDMKALRESGLAERLIEFYGEGGFLFGLCGGYQMLGRRIDDRWLRDNDELKEIEGLDLLPVETTFAAEKTTIQSRGHLHPSFFDSAFDSAGLPPEAPEVEGYEIHFGETRRLKGERGPEEEKEEKEEKKFRPLFLLNGREDGLAAPDFRVAGTYLHNAFHNDAFRGLWLNALRRRRGLPERPAADTAGEKNFFYDALAREITRHLDISYILSLAGVR